MNEQQYDLIKKAEHILDRNKVFLTANYMQREDPVYVSKGLLIVQAEGLPNLNVLMELADLCSCSHEEIEMHSEHEVLIDSESTYAGITYIKISMPIRC